MRSWKLFCLVIVLMFLALQCKGPEGPMGPPGRDGDRLLTDPSIMPKVIYTYPPMNSVGPYDELYRLECDFYYCFSISQLQVRFNKIMDITSVRKSLILSSPSGDIRADTNRIVAVGGDVVLISAVDSNGYSFNYRFKIGQTYRLGISDGARDINGNYLQPAFEMTFVPEPYFRVLKINPPNGSVIPSYYSPLWIQFNSPVDESIFSHISISPSPAGRWHFNYDSTEIYFSHSGFDQSQFYSVMISEEAHDRYGNRLPDLFLSTFQTTPFKTISTYPQDGAVDVPLYASISISFNSVIDTSTVRNAFRIEPPVDGILFLYNGSSSFTFDPSVPLINDTQYVVTIDTSLTSLAGKKLSEQHQFRFSTVSFRVTGTSPADGSINVPPYSGVSVNCNSEIVFPSAVSAFRIVPEIAGNFNYEITGFSFYPVVSLAPETDYAVIIDTSLRSVSGARLKNPYVFSFSTAPYEVHYTNPADGQTDVPVTNVLWIHTNFRIDTTTLRTAFELKDVSGASVPGGFLYYQHSPQYFGFDPLENLAPATLYTARIDTSLHGISGYAVKMPYSFSFTTAN